MSFTAILLFSVAGFLLPTPSDAALPNCTTSGCPAGGIWTEWVTNETCSASCGSCAEQYYTRSCLSESVNCSCIGDTSRYVLCNSQVCVYPSERTCCIPYLSMIINGSMQCGPFPKTTVENTTSCCPLGGLWSDWGGWVADGSGNFVQSRSCASADIGCPCTGILSNTVTGCPCPDMQSPASIISTCSIGSGYFSTTNTSINSTTCTMTATLLANNDNITISACSAYTTYKPFDYVAVVSFYSPTNTANTCPQDRPFDCQARYQIAGQDNKTLPITFTCDMDSGKWRYDAGGYLVEGFAQIIT